MSGFIRIKGASQHNLKNVSLDIPRNLLVVITGVSGSGKSSLAFDTIYAEGQRRYVESLSTYARQFIGQMDKPDVDSIEGLSPAIAIEQRSTTHNPRSTVGSRDGIYDISASALRPDRHPHCPVCGREIRSQKIDTMVETILNLPDKTRLTRSRPGRPREKRGISKGIQETAEGRIMSESGLTVKSANWRRTSSWTRTGDTISMW
jgi:excinuclease ABC subunit A